jgi:DNA-3-methyladenine glycosylase II
MAASSTPPRRSAANAKAQASAAKSKPKASAAKSKAQSRTAIAALRAADPVLRALIDDFGPLPHSRDGRPQRHDHYGALVRSIINQQLSVHAGRAIYQRLIGRYGGSPPTPQQVLADQPEELRAAAGLSRAKVGFLRSLAEHVLDGSLKLAELDQLPDEEVIAELVAVKGLGVWTAHMFLMFHLERPDVLAVGDLGIRRAIERAYRLRELPDPATIERIAEPWRPHRTLACRYLWRSLDNEP